MKRIAIIGGGISAVTLALRLQQLGVEATVYTDSSMDELRPGPLLNTVARFHPTLERERTLGVDHWRGAGHGFRRFDVSVGPPVSAQFTGRTADAVEAVDFRVLLPRWVEDFVRRGGEVVCGLMPRDPYEVERLADGHDLVVVAVGRRSMSPLFPVDRARSPYEGPQRLLLAALVEGLALPDPLALSFNVSPGAGELFQMPILTASGLGTNILIEAVPGGPLADIVTRDRDEPGFIPGVLDALATHAPAIAARVDPARFRVRSRRDVLQGAITPAVRHAYAQLHDGAPALAIGDAWITNDPITGQGANLASHCAFVAADAIAEGGPYDQRWGARTEAAMWKYAGPVTAWTNGFLQPPPPHVLELLQAATEHPAVADAFASGFAAPVELASALANADSTAAFIDATAVRQPVA